MLHLHLTSKLSKCSLLAILILIPLLSNDVLAPITVSAAGNSIYVPDTYSTIQSAVNAAKPGDTIYVAAGNYTENVLVKKDNLRIIGHGSGDTFLNGNVTGNGFQIEASQVSVSGFNITNCETAILINNVSSCTIADNYVTNSKWGIWVTYSSKCNVQRNTVVDCEHNLRLSYSTNNIVKENDIRGNHSYNFALFGSTMEHYFQTIDKTNKVNGKSIYYISNAENLNLNPQSCPDLGCLLVINSSKITVKDLSISNSYAGIMFAYVSSSTIQSIESINNKIGIELFKSQNCQVTNSLVKYNMYHGILLGASSQCLVDNNNVTGNTDGIYVSTSSNSTFTRNTIVDSDVGLKIYSSAGNQFFHNNLANNAEQTDISSAQKNVFDDGKEGNYWSNYEGEDTNSDAIGDTDLPCENLDNYPLMGKYREFTATKDGQSHIIETISNGEIISLSFEQSNGIIAFNATGEEESCFARLVIPTALLSDSSKLVVNNLKPTIKIETSNDTHNTLYITYKPINNPDKKETNASSTLVADAGPDQNTTTNMIVFFNGGGSHSNELITKYKWSFGDGAAGSGKAANYTYTRAGNYTVTLEVEDATGNQESDTLVVTVRDSSVNPDTEFLGEVLAVPMWLIVITAVADCCAVVTLSVVFFRKRKLNKPIIK